MRLFERLNRGEAKCPIDHEAMVKDWAEANLLCSAGRREMKLGRYLRSRRSQQRRLSRAFGHFHTGSGALTRQAGFLAVVGGPVTKFATAVEEVEFLSELIAGAGLIERADLAWSGHDIPVPVPMACPVTGIKTVYTFFPVAFCRNSSNPNDPLYDPALSCPFPAINMTSDAFAFALLVR